MFDEDESLMSCHLNIMYKTDPAMHPNNAAMMVFTSVVVVALSFRAAAEGLVKGIIRFDVPQWLRLLCSKAQYLKNVLCRNPKSKERKKEEEELEKKSKQKKKKRGRRCTDHICIHPLGPSLFEPLGWSNER